MTTYYLVHGNDIVAAIERGPGAVTALPLLAEGKAMSLINEAHIEALKASLKQNQTVALAALGLADKRAEPAPMKE